MQQHLSPLRRTYLVERRLQFRYLLTILLPAALSAAIASGITFYVVWDAVITEFFFVPEAGKRLGDLLMKTSTLVIGPMLCLLVVFAVIGLVLSNRIAGPIFRLKRIAAEIAKGGLDLRVSFRKRDRLEDLSDSLNGMVQGLRAIAAENKALVADLASLSGRLSERAAGDPGGSAAELEDLVRRLQEASGRFRT